MTPLLDSKTKKGLLDVTQAGIGKASVLSISLAIVILCSFGGATAFLYFNRDGIVSLVNAVHDIDHLRNAHNECSKNVEEVKHRLELAERKIEELTAGKVAAK